jgi:hypothetical protein
MRASEGVTVQIHETAIKTPDGAVKGVPVVALWIPSDMGRDWLVQEPGGTDADA